VSGWTILEALATLGGTVVLLIGAIAGALYGRKANPSISGHALRQTDGRVVLVVRPSLAAPGIIGLHIITKDGRHKPQLSATEVLTGADGLRDGARYESPIFKDQDVVSGGETIAESRAFLMPDPTPDLVGWRVQFFVDVRKGLKRWQWWSWAADAFVEVPPYDGAHGRSGATEQGPGDGQPSR
jgi:hypothetical protein